MCDEFLRRPQGNLILYPEGTRSGTGEIQAFKKGAGLFAVELGVPVVPAHIGGARNILAKGQFLPRPGTVTVRFGEPIRFASNPFDHLPARGLRKAAVELLERRIRELGQKPGPRRIGRIAGEGTTDDDFRLCCRAGKSEYKES